MYSDKIISHEDYAEPACPFCNPTKTESFIPTDRVVAALDRYLDKNDYDGALKTLLYWEEEAKKIGDDRGLLTVENELCGLYRKLSKKDEAYDACEKVLSLIDKLEVGKTVTAGTALLNVATVYKAFGEAQRGLPLFDRALEIYGANLREDDPAFGGLYNNKGLALCDLGRFDEALDCYKKAIEIMKNVPSGEWDAAISYLNAADVYYRDKGQEAEAEIERCIETAWELLNGDEPQNGYYAFVAEKCAPTFGYYGYFFYERELKARAKKIYEGN